jgi:hypothetical protein
MKKLYLLRTKDDLLLCRRRHTEELGYYLLVCAVVFNIAKRPISVRLLEALRSGNAILTIVYW